MTLRIGDNYFDLSFLLCRHLLEKHWIKTLDFNKINTFFVLSFSSRNPLLDNDTKTMFALYRIALRSVTNCISEGFCSHIQHFLYRIAAKTLRSSK